MGDTRDSVSLKRIVFVTVGTTCFDALVKAVDTLEVKQELTRRGYTHLLIQMGRGTYVPTKSLGEDGLMAVDYFTFSSSIADHLRSASLVISHAGSGSIFETLRHGKPLIVVVNEDLMDNHQSELAEELAARKHLYCAHPQSLHQVIAGMDLESLLPYQPGDATPVAKGTMALLGDDGRGYQLALKLESCGVWRTWLGDSCYSTFHHALSTPASWESFMRTDDSKSRAQIHLQLRARALLFDKATISLFLPSNQPPSSVAVSKLNPNYLQLDGGDVYFTLESSSQDGVQHRESSAASSTTSGKRFRNEELPETWYDQFIEKYRVSRQYKLSLGDRELDRRTAEGMSSYLRHLEKYKIRRVPFQNDHSNSALDVINSTDSDVFFPETMFTLNSVPEIAVPQIIVEETKQNIEFNGVLDTLPQCMTKSPVMIERLGIRPEYLGMEQEGNSHHGNSALEGNKKCFSEEQASQISQKVIARMLTGGGFEGATEVPLEVLSEMLGSHICKLGRILKVLSDNYRKQCSALELLKMFLQAAGHSNFGILAELIKDGNRNAVQQSQELIKDGSRNIVQQSQELIKDGARNVVQQSQELIKDGTRNIVQQNQELVKEGTRNFVQQSPQQVHGAQSQLQSHQQSPVKLPQQVPRQMHQQMQQMVQPQNLAFQQMQQQHLERSRMRQPSTPRPGMDMDKDRSMSQVNAENSSKLPMDANALNASNAKQSQMQFHQQQLNTMSNLQAQSSNQFKQSTPVQIPQMHSPNMGVVRAPPVKVDGFQELMGGDASMKHDSEENKLTSPISK